MPRAKADPVIRNLDDVLKLVISDRMVLQAPFARSKICELTLPNEMTVEGVCDSRIFFGLKQAIQQNLIDPDPDCEAVTLRYVQLQEPGCAPQWAIVDGANLAALEYEINSSERMMQRPTYN